MSRRLTSPNQPVFGRLDVYLVLLVVDLLIASICFTKWKTGWMADQLVAQFCLAHLVVTLLLLLGATPTRAMLMTWLWRFRGRQSWSRDSLFFGRAEITLTLVGMCVIGGAVPLVGFVLPATLAASLESGSKSVPFDWGSLGEYLLVTSLLLFALGMVCQWCQVFAGKQGAAMFFCIVLFLNLFSPLLAGLLDLGDFTSRNDAVSDLLYSLSPAVFFLLADRQRLGRSTILATADHR